MNCRLGDLAIVIKSTFGESVGKIVSVVSVEPFGIAEWLVEIPRNPGPFAGLWACHDSWLRPIRPGDLHETTDERKEVTA